jgi:hypothetical protein
VEDTEKAVSNELAAFSTDASGILFSFSCLSFGEKIKKKEIFLLFYSVNTIISIGV